MMIEEYFKQPYFEQALDSFVRAKPHWPLRARYEMYRLGIVAFASDESDSAKREAAAKLYGKLIDFWDILRPFARADCWNGDRVFETLAVGCGPGSRSSGADLINFHGRLSFDVALHCVSQFGEVKPVAHDFQPMQ